MIPYRSSSASENCSPMSSNCVLWQGPDIACINLCKGDSVSDIVYKLATELCAIKDSTNISNVEFDCLLNECASTTNPEVTIAGILQLIIDNVCCSVTSLTSVTSELSARTSSLYEEPTISLPLCLQYLDPSTGLPVTSLVLSTYVINLANEICNLRSTVDTHTTQIADHETRIEALENAPGYVPPVVVPNCSYGPIIAGVPTEMNLLLDALDDEYCQLRGILGTNTQLVSAASAQCSSLGSLNALSQAGTMSSIPGWNNVITNLGQSLQNMWLTICDMRAVMYDLKNCCGQADCSAFILSYQATATRGVGETNNVTLIFNSGTIIPSGFSNCPLLSTVTITDGDGHTYTDTIDLLVYASDPSGVTFDVSGSSLNILLPYTVTVTGCIVKDSTSCSKVVTVVIPPTTTTTTVAPICNTYSIQISNTDLSAAIGNTNPTNDGVIYVMYIPCNSASPIVANYSTSGDQGFACVNVAYTPYAYYFASDILTPASSTTLTLEGSCGLS